MTLLIGSTETVLGPMDSCPIDELIAPARRFSPELCSLNMGSMNFSFHPLAKRYDTWKFDWGTSLCRKLRYLYFPQYIQGYSNGGRGVGWRAWRQVRT